MSLARVLVPLLVVLFALAGCAEADKVLFQSLAGERPVSPEELEKEAALKAAIEAASKTVPALGTGRFRAPPVTMPRPSGSPADRTVRDLADAFTQIRRDVGDRDSELQLIRAALTAKIEDYVDARKLMRRRIDLDSWRQAQIRLDLVYLEIDRLNALAAKASIDSGSATRIIAAARGAQRLPSASDADRTQLAVLEKEADALLILLHKMLGEIHGDISSQNDYANVQRDEMTQIAARLNLAGGATTARAPAGSTPSPAKPAPAKPSPAKPSPAKPRKMAPAPAKPAKSVAPAKTVKSAPRPVRVVSPDGRRPLVTIRFGRENVDYAQPLYEAVSYVVERRPDVRFDILAVTPAVAGSKALSAKSRARVQGVLSTLARMGVPKSRIRVSAVASPEAQTDMVQIFVQ